MLEDSGPVVLLTQRSIWQRLIHGDGELCR